MSSADTPKYWFPAKRYGWGWGLPQAWQGWLVLVTYLALIIGGIPFVKVSKGDFMYVAYVLVLTIILIAICWISGEPPRWRWGNDD
jgi:hypothetical protein